MLKEVDVPFLARRVEKNSLDLKERSLILSVPCDLCDGGDVDVMVPWGRATFPPPAGQGDLPAEVQSAQANSTFLDKGWRGLLGLSQPEAEGAGAGGD